MLDACLVITFGNIESLDIVASLGSHRIAIASRAAGEVRRPPASLELARCLDDGSIEKVAIDPYVAAEQDALVRFDASARFRGRGDAEVLAIAAARGWIVGSDELAIQRVALQEFGPRRLAGTLDFLRWAVIESRVTVAEAVGTLNRLDVAPTLLRRIRDAGLTPEAVLGAAGT